MKAIEEENSNKAYQRKLKEKLLREKSKEKITPLNHRPPLPLVKVINSKYIETPVKTSKGVVLYRSKSFREPKAKPFHLDVDKRINQSDTETEIEMAPSMMKHRSKHQKMMGNLEGNHFICRLRLSQIKL